MEWKHSTALNSILSSAWETLARAPLEDSPLRTPVLANVDENGRPAARIVALRRFDRLTRSLYINTDRRSPKFRELSFRPEAIFVFYDPAPLVQLRISTDVILHQNNPIARELWDELPMEARALYMTVAPPGEKVVMATDGLPATLQRHAPTDDELSIGYANFAVIEAIVKSLDYLRLSDDGHRRARFVWLPDGELEESWLVP